MSRTIRWIRSLKKEYFYDYDSMDVKVLAGLAVGIALGVAMIIAAYS